MILKCANCNNTLCYESDILGKIEDDDYDEQIDGYYCMDFVCDKCSYVNNVVAKVGFSVTDVSVD